MLTLLRLENIVFMGSIPKKPFWGIKYVRQEHAKDTFKSEQKWNQQIINKKKFQFLTIKKFHPSLDSMTSSIIRTSRDCSELSEDYRPRETRVHSLVWVHHTEKKTPTWFSLMTFERWHTFHSRLIVSINNTKSLPGM